MASLSQLGEFGLIERFKAFGNLSRRVVKGIGDDAAVLELDHQRFQLFTTDMMVEDVHFTRRMLPRQVGWKVLAVNVSDIAAMGGLPTVAVVSIGIPYQQGAGSREQGKLERRNLSRAPSSELPASYLLSLYQGLQDCAKVFGVSIVGGDTVKSDKLVINIALLGEVAKKDLVLRSGAQPGDVIFVTGRLGGSLKSGRHLSFMPCVKEARWLVKHARPTAMMDISDGLSGDLGHILRSSGVGAVLDEASIPCHRGVSADQALSDGEDFELLFTVPLATARRLIRQKKYYPVGAIVHAHEGCQLRCKNGKVVSLINKGFRHF